MGALIPVFKLSVGFQQFALLCGEPGWHFDHDPDDKIAAAMATQAGHPLPAQAEFGARLRPRRDLELHHPGKARDLELRAQRGLREAHGDLTVQVVATSREQRVFPNTNDNIEIPAISRTEAGLPLAGGFQGGPCLPTCRNLHGKRSIEPRSPRPAAISAQVLNDPPLAPTGRAGLADGEEPLGVPDLTASPAGATGGGRGPRLGAAPFTGAACLEPRDDDLLLRPKHRFLQGDLKIIAEIETRGRAATRRVPEKSLEEILEDRAESCISESLGARSDADHAEPVVGRSLLGIAEDLIGLRDLFEPLFRSLVARVLIRMMLVGQPPIGPFDLLCRGLPLNPKNLVIVALAHSSTVSGFGFRIRSLGVRVSGFGLTARSSNLDFP